MNVPAGEWIEVGPGLRSGPAGDVDTGRSGRRMRGVTARYRRVAEAASGTLGSESPMTVNISNRDGRGTLMIQPQPELSQVSARVRATWGSLEVENDSVAFLNATEFLAQLREFERTRRTTARLEGTYNVEITVSPFESRGDAMVTFSITDLIHLPGSTPGRWELHAGIVVGGEFVGAMLRQFEDLFE